MIFFRVRTHRLTLTFLSLLVFSFSLAAQSKGEKKKIFARAESHFLYEEYELANPLYLLLDSPDNLNILYKIGTSYVNIPGEKQKAIPYLESAVEYAAYDANPTSFREKRAPLDAYFSLAKAYLIDNNTEDALKTLNKFRELASDTEDKGGMKNVRYIDQLISSCRNAIEIQKSPLDIIKQDLGPDFSQGSINDNPAVSFDGNTIAFTERRGMVSAVFVSRKVNGRWETPVEITRTVEAGEDCSTCSLNSDGTELFLYKNDGYDGNIFSSVFSDGRWNPIKKLNRNINTRFYESHAAISADGKTLYFTSNREGGTGGLDIYYAVRDFSGDWGPAVNMGTGINTPYNEDTPFITISDSLLYFSSEGHRNMGGYDIFISKRENSSWSAPWNIGYPINTTDDDKFFQPFNNHLNGYYSMTTDYKQKDIFYITFRSDVLRQGPGIRGIFSVKDTVVFFDDRYSVYLLDRTTGDTIDTAYPDRSTGQYNLKVKPGKYRLVYSGEGCLPMVIDTTMVSDDPASFITINVELEKDPSYIPHYERIDLSRIPVVDEIDSSILIRDLQVMDITENDEADTTVLYYTVQVMALYNPVDISYFRYVSDIKVLYNENDRFYRYTTGIFIDKQEAYAHRDDLIRKGYPNDLFIKKVSRIPGERPVLNQRFFTVQLKATRTPVDRNIFRGYEGVRETREIDGLYHYLYGRFPTVEEAKAVLERIEEAEFSDAFVREINILIDK